ncbi:MAG: hypothetical protein A3K19_28500 [Lentisphaerae bacterium RIFOXYB12_FULL_65_16]|nr:MAG: hypothetical protein A3K18_19750 [Lentisphaerae bacterium RIFOXYA12_64_32]OGV85527.1 MAG: hypothetical protein A3K19_28500 [Lentisphaerae bacterium RIFOXYB12_FULL_65_16]
MHTVAKHLYWSAKGPMQVNLDDPKQRLWWLQQVLTHGTMADVATLDLDGVRRCLPALELPDAVRTLWRDYFAQRRPQSVPPQDS